MFAKQVMRPAWQKVARATTCVLNSFQGWITASQECDAVRISASDGFDLTSCVAPKPQPQPQNVRPQSAAPAVELKNPYRGLIKEGKVCWVRPHATLSAPPLHVASHLCQVVSVSTLAAKNACASPEVFLRLYGTRGVSPTVKLSECASVSTVLFLPGTSHSACNNLSFDASVRCS
jgi:hypothetical protein